MNVLIADDDNLMIRLLSTAFQKAGFATFVAFDVVQATMLVRRQRIDAVVLDMAMPGGSGADVIHRLKLSKKTGDIPIIVVSGSVEPDAPKRILAMGADDFFPKPPDLEDLVISLRRLTDNAPKSRITNSIAARLVTDAMEYHGA
jgi:DNA-binding response OmpR family regulator